MNEFVLPVSIIGVIPFGFFLLMLVLQSVFPRRKGAVGGWARRLNNLSLFLVNTVVMRFVVPVALVGVAAWASSSSLGLFNIGSGLFNTSSGLFNNSSGLSDSSAILNWVTIAVCVIVLDLAIYWQHVATHKFPILWRMHKVHHADPDMDVTTAVRFHPLELLLSLAYKSVCVVLLGAPVAAVVVFELLLFIGPAFNHSNLRLPLAIDKILRWFIATPDTHRAHHSTVIEEQNTNYGFFIIWWDKLFGTYTEVPHGGHIDMAIGLRSAEDQCDRVDQMLVAPFRE